MPHFSIKKNVTFFLFFFVLSLAVGLLPANALRLSAGLRPTSETDTYGRSIAKSIGTLKRRPRPQQVNAHVLAASYYSLRDGLSARLILSDQGPRSMDIGIVLFSLNGDRLDLPLATLASQEVREFNLDEQARAAGAKFTEGSLAVSYSGTDMELGGVLKLVDLNRSLIFDEELSEPLTLKSSRLEGVWWLPSPRAELKVIASNTSDSQVSATLIADGSKPKRSASKALSLGPHQTQAIDVDELFGKAGARPQIGGISIAHSGTPGAILARMLIRDAVSAYSSVAEFYDPDGAQSSRLDGAGLRIGSVGKDKLRQVAVARNVGNATTSVLAAYRILMQMEVWV